MAVAAPNTTILLCATTLARRGTRYLIFICFACNSSRFWLLCRSPLLRCGTRRIFFSACSTHAAGHGLVTLGAVLASWTVMILRGRFSFTGLSVFTSGSFLFFLPCLGKYRRACGGRRFSHSSPCGDCYRHVCIEERWVPLPTCDCCLGVLGGGVLAVVILVLGDRLQRRGLPDVKLVTAFLSFFGPGFQKEDGTSAHEGHFVALWSFLLCFSRIRWR